MESLSVAPKSEGRKNGRCHNAKVPAWMVLKAEMMPHLIRAHEKVGRTLTEEEIITLLRSWGFEISEAE